MYWFVLRATLRSPPSRQQGPANGRDQTDEQYDLQSLHRPRRHSPRLEDIDNYTEDDVRRGDVRQRMLHDLQPRSS